MSTLYVDTDIDLVVITLNKKDGSGTTTFTLGKEFYPAEGIYSGSPVVYPALVDLPSITRSCGTNVAVRHSTTIRVWAHTPLSSVTDCFADLLQTHDYQNGTCEVRYYAKSDDGTTTDGGDNIRATLEIVAIGAAIDDNVLEIQARDTWFKDKEFGRRFVAADFGNNVDEYEEAWKGEFAPVTFGDSEDGATGVIASSCPLYNSDLGSGFQSIHLNVGLCPDTSLYSKRSLYVRNPFKHLDSRDWLPLSTFNNIYAFKAPYHGPTTLVAGTNFPMYRWRFAAKITPGSSARLIGGATVRLIRVGTITEGMGQLLVTVKEAVQVNGTNWATVGNVLAQAALDAVNLSTSASNVNFYFETPFVAVPGHSYFVICEWTNTTDTTNYINIKYDTTVTLDPCYTNDQQVTREAWTETAAQFQMQVWDFGAESAVFGSDFGDYLIVTQRLDNLMPGTNPYQFSGVDLKAGVGGLIDTVAGLYTGSANARIENPAAIIHFLLRDTVFGAGVSASFADYTEIDSVRAYIGSNLKAAWVQESPASVGEMIAELCRQFRLRFFKTRGGKMSLNFPMPMTTDLVFDLSEGANRGDLRLVSIQESSDGDLVNSIDALYSPDALGVRLEEALNRKVKDQKYLELEFIRDGKTGEGYDDATRGAFATASQALYGIRSAVWRWFMHIRQAGARYVLNYYFDRYHKQRKLVTIRVPRRSWYSSIDLFTKGRVFHSRLPGYVGARSDEPVKESDGAGTLVTAHYDGVPITGFNQGEHSGEVLRIEESGAYMLVTVENMNSFAGSF